MTRADTGLDDEIFARIKLQASAIIRHAIEYPEENSYRSSVVFQVPSHIVGFPFYDARKMAVRLEEHLQKNLGYYARLYPTGNVMYISWKDRTARKKKEKPVEEDRDAYYSRYEGYHIDPLYGVQREHVVYQSLKPPTVQDKAEDAVAKARRVLAAAKR